MTDTYGTPSATILPACMNKFTTHADFDAGDQGGADHRAKVTTARAASKRCN